MKSTDLTEILRQTISDHRVSRSERRALQELASEINLDQHQLSLLRSQVFEIARQELDASDEKAINKWVEDVLKAIRPRQTRPAIESEAIFSPEEACSQKIVSLIQKARLSIDVCVFTITDNFISDALLAAHNRKKVTVRVISDNHKAHDPGSDVQRLADAGIQVRTDDSPAHMHHKYAMFDRAWLLTGSYNWTRSAAKVNEENIVVTNDRNLIDEFSGHFEKLWQRYR